MGDLGTEAVGLGQRGPGRRRSVRLFEHGRHVVVVVKARGEHVVEAMGGDQGEVVL